mgnify:CR=1 FL=1
MKLSLSTGTLYVYPLRMVFRRARMAGFDGVELVVNPEAIVRGGLAVRRLADAEGVEIFSVHPTVVPLPGWRERHGGMDRTIRLAQEAGARLVVMHTPRSASLDKGEGLAFRRTVEAWRRRLAGSNLRLAIENKDIRAEAHRRYALSPLNQLRAFADRHDLGLVLLFLIFSFSGEDLMYARQTFGERLIDVHLSDMRGWLSPLPLSSLRRALGQHLFPATGDLPLADLLSALSGDGYAGPVTLEVNPIAIRIWWPPTVRRRLAQAVKWMRRVTGAEAPSGE